MKNLENASTDRLEIDEHFFDDMKLIESRVAGASAESQGAVRSALKYLYITQGDEMLRNLTAKNRKKAWPYLSPAERVVTNWLYTRTNGKLRKTYGHLALDAARKSHYRCKCGYTDVRALNLDHVKGRIPNTPFDCLCANCHAIKSREKGDWDGASRNANGAMIR